jgi:hypothetical protein
MSDIVYIWGAYSKTLNQKFHEVNLESNNMLTDRNIAQKWADSFASRLVQNNHMHTNDWIPIVEERQRL